ncbi:MAG TPA: hypothetical protein VFW21_11965 [Mycobacterium sp.]|nr:hypothetical protein [Mycobacterium sp.]
MSDPTTPYPNPYGPDNPAPPPVKVKKSRKRAWILAAAFVGTLLVGIGIGAAGGSGNKTAGTAGAAPAPTVTTTATQPGAKTTVTRPGPTTTTTKPVPGPTVTATKQAAPPRPPAPSHVIADGDTVVVGEDVPAGTYEAHSTSDSCYWEIWKSAAAQSSGDVNGMVNNDIGAKGHLTVVLKSGQVFDSQDCGDWSKK